MVTLRFGLPWTSPLLRRLLQTCRCTSGWALRRRISGLAGELLQPRSPAKFLAFSSRALLYFSSVWGGGHGPKDNKQCCLLEIQTGRRKEARRRASILTSGQTFGDAFESDLLSTTVGVSLKNSQLRAQTFSECTVWSGILFVGFCLWRSA